MAKNQSDSNENNKTPEEREADLVKREEAVTKGEAALEEKVKAIKEREEKLGNDSAKEKRGSEIPDFMAPGYDGPLTAEQAEKINKKKADDAAAEALKKK